MSTSYYQREEVIQAVHDEMKSLYRQIFNRKHVRTYHQDRHREVTDVRHCVRTFLWRKHNAKPTEMATAESRLRRYGNTDHKAFFYSAKIVDEVLPIARPAFLRRMRSLILNNQQSALTE